MSLRLRKYGPLLRWLYKAKPSSAKAIIKTGDKELMKILSECSLNVLKGVVPLKGIQRSRLKKYKNNLRTLSKRKISCSRKKALLQKGGFLKALLGPILGVLGGILGLNG